MKLAKTIQYRALLEVFKDLDIKPNMILRPLKKSIMVV